MKKDKDFSTKLMAFTFFYAVAIYTMSVGFFFWDKHIRDKKNDQSEGLLKRNFGFAITNERDFLLRGRGQWNDPLPSLCL